MWIFECMVWLKEKLSKSNNLKVKSAFFIITKVLIYNFCSTQKYELESFLRKVLSFYLLLISDIDNAFENYCKNMN